MLLLSTMIISEITLTEWLNYLKAFIGCSIVPIFATVMLLTIIYGMGKDKTDD